MTAVQSNSQKFNNGPTFGQIDGRYALESVLTWLRHRKHSFEHVGGRREYQSMHTENNTVC